MEIESPLQLFSLSLQSLTFTGEIVLNRRTRSPGIPILGKSCTEYGTTSKDTGYYSLVVLQ